MGTLAVLSQMLKSSRDLLKLERDLVMRKGFQDKGEVPVHMWCS